MKRIAIVSSYDEECGAAFYSSRLKVHLERAGYQVDVKRLPVGLLRVSKPEFVRRKGDAEIARICREIADYDSVLLQFEPGLYGTTARSSYRRVEQLLRAARQAVVTVHGFERALRQDGFIEWAGAVLKWKIDDAYKIFTFQADKSEIRRFWTNVQGMSHVQVMTFCKGDATILRRFFDLTRVSDFPITYFDAEEAETINRNTDREALLRQYGLDPNKKYFSVLGFLNAYKGHLTALKALEHLPDDWHFAIIGGEHPQGLSIDKDIGPYVRQLLAFSNYQRPDARQELPALDNAPRGLAGLFGKRSSADDDLRLDLLELSEFKNFLPKKDISARVHFLGQVSDAEMPKFYTGIDYICHPYMVTKSGQSGSGPATMAVELGARALFTNAPVFREMSQYFDGAMPMFGIGNFVEMAESMQRYENFEPGVAAAREAALKKYNPATMVAAYRDLMGG